jgi:hypothetical protein
MEISGIEVDHYGGRDVEREREREIIGYMRLVMCRGDERGVGGGPRKNL